MERLRTEGSAVWYRRLPLSRNRTPDASDMDMLHRCAFAAAAAGGDGVGVGRDVKFVVLARAAATSTSTSFVAHFLCLALAALAALNGRTGEADSGPAAKVRRTDGAAAADALSFSVLDNLCRCVLCAHMLWLLVAGREAPDAPQESPTDGAARCAGC